MTRNKVTITNKKKNIKKDFALQRGDIITHDDTNIILTVVNVGIQKYSLISIDDDFRRWNDTCYSSLEEISDYVKKRFTLDKLNVYRNNSIDITLGDRID